MASKYMPSPDEYLDSLEGEFNGKDFKHKGPKEPRRKRPWGKYFKRSLLVLILLAVIAVVGAAFFGFYTLSGVSKQPYNFNGLASNGGRTNVLLLGDGDPGHAGQKLTDTVLVLSFNATTGQVASISVPRDLRVKIDGYGYNKINQANALGGVALAKQTVSQTLGIPIDYTILTNFTGLSSLVDAVGGIDVNVKTALIDPEYPCASDESKACGINIQPGQQHMDGAKALEYSRCRKGTCGNDFGRAARQQEVIELLMKKMYNPRIVLDPTKLAAVSSALRDNLDTDLSGINMARLARLYNKTDPAARIHLVLSTAPDGFLRNGGGSDLVPTGGTFTAIQTQVADIFTSPPKQPANQ